MRPKNPSSHSIVSRSRSFDGSSKKEQIAFLQKQRRKLHLDPLPAGGRSRRRLARGALRAMGFASLSLCPAGRANGPHLSSGGVLYLSRKTGDRTPAC